MTAKLERKICDLLLFCTSSTGPVQAATFINCIVWYFAKDGDRIALVKPPTRALTRAWALDYSAHMACDRGQYPGESVGLPLLPRGLSELMCRDFSTVVYLELASRPEKGEACKNVASAGCIFLQTA